jgi:phage baseplate assembly protein W
LPGGSALDYPIRADRRGTLATTADIGRIVEQSIIAIIETRQGERVMLPDYGVPDLVFSVMDSGFVARLAYFVERQILRYEPLVATVSVDFGQFEEGSFSSGAMEEQQKAAIHLLYTISGDSTPRNLVYPVWQLTQ